MRLVNLQVKGITRFADPVTIDFQQLGEGLIALAGKNGEGKTTVLESAFAGLHLEYPTRPGSLYSVAHGRDASIEIELTNGTDPYRAVVAIDAIGQRTEAYLYRDGQPVTGGKVRDYVAAVVERFGSPKLMLAAALSAQNKRGSFLDLSKVDRKALVCELLDVEGLQHIAEHARTRSKDAESRLASMRGEVATLTREIESLDATLWTVDLDAMTAKRAELQAVIPKLDAEVDRLRELYSDLDKRHVLALKAAQDRATKERQAADIERRIGELQAKAHRLPDEEAAAKSTATARILEAEQEAGKLEEYQEAARKLETAETEMIAQEGNLAGLRANLTAARLDADDAQAAVVKLDQAERELATAKQETELLGLVPCTRESAWVMPRSGSTIALASLCPLLANAQGAAARAERLTEVVAQHAEARQEAVIAKAGICTAELAIRNAEEQLRSTRDRVQSLTARSCKAESAHAASLRVADLKEDLGVKLLAIQDRGKELGEDIYRLSMERGDILSDLMAEVDDPAPIAAEMQATAAKGKEKRATLDQTRATLVTIERDITRAEEAKKRRQDLAARLDAVKVGEQTLVADLADWQTLERAFGRDGIQALEIDAAGPELSSLTNELLTSCFGERFEIRFVTQQLRADGKGSKEVFDVQVIDHDRGREGAVDSLSGGEKTIVSEAISLALAIYVGRHSGRRYETLWRDETAGQLDPDNALKYVAMLRRARVLAGAHHVVFIAQQPEVWSQADAVLWVENGRVEVRQ